MFAKQQTLHSIVSTALLGLLVLWGCKKQEASSPPAPQAGLLATKTPPLPIPQRTSTAKPEPRALDAGAAPAAPRPVVVRMGARPECKAPEPILSEQGLKWFNDRERRQLPMPLTWGAVWYLRGPDGKETLQQDQGHDVALPYAADVFDSNYFAGLLPNRTAGVIAGAAARFVAVNERWRHKADGFDTVWLGTLSDHCMPAAANDDTLLFSIKLSDHAALQALVEREEKLTDYSVQYYGQGDAVMPKEMLKTLSKKDKKVREAVAVRLRTVKLPWDGTVLFEGPRMDYSEYARWNFRLFDDKPTTPMVAAIASPAYLTDLTIAARDGRFLVHRKRPCGDSPNGLRVVAGRNEDGRLTIDLLEATSGEFRCITNEEEDEIERVLNTIGRADRGRHNGVD